jgi:hypothetical protein
MKATAELIIDSAVTGEGAQAALMTLCQILVEANMHEELDESDDDIYDAKARAEAILFGIATDWATEIRSKDDGRR